MSLVTKPKVRVTVGLGFSFQDRTFDPTETSFVHLLCLPLGSDFLVTACRKLT